MSMIDLVKAVAERVALSVENARLFEETSRRAEVRHAGGARVELLRRARRAPQCL